MDKIANQKVNTLAKLDSSTRQHQEFLMTPRHEALLLALWKRLAQLYGSKFTHHNPLKQNLSDGLTERYSDIFVLWAKKTKNLKDAGWRRGMEKIEYMHREAAKQGDLDIWPPNYAAFLGLCDAPPNAQIYKHFRTPILTNQDAVDRSKKIGIKTIAHLKSIFKYLDDDQGQIEKS